MDCNSTDRTLYSDLLLVDNQKKSIFSVWDYVHKQPSHPYIESITDSEAICISRKELDHLFETSLIFANLGKRIVEEFALLYEGWHIKMWRQSAFNRYLSLLDEYPEVVGCIPLK